MAKKSGVSHALAALVSMVLGKVLVVYLQPYFPVIIDPLERWGDSIEGWLAERPGVTVSGSFIAPLFVAIVLAFAWGVLYHAMRHGSRSDD